MTTVSQGIRSGVPDTDDNGATMPLMPLSKSARRPDMDDASPPPVNHRDSRQDLSDAPVCNNSDDVDMALTSTRTISNSTEDADSNQISDNLATATEEDSYITATNQTDDAEAESIALARLLMEQEAIESYGALSADYLRYNANQFSREDLAALQAAMAEDEASDGGAGVAEQPFSYDAMLRLGESIGDVKKERWRMDAQSQINKLPEFQFDPHQAQGKDENDCDAKCLVCQFPYEEQEKLRRLPCGHAFHSECVEQWLKDNDVCPYCRQTIVVDDE
jgi:hypothetical protein